MKYISSYKLFEGVKKSYTKEDHLNLDELTKEVGDILLDLVDEYGLTDVTSGSRSNNQFFNRDFRYDDDHQLHEIPNSYVLYNNTKATRHGVYGYVMVIINCEDIYYRSRDKEVPSNKLLDDTMLRLNTIGHADLSVDSGDIEIKIIPRN